MKPWPLAPKRSGCARPARPASARRAAAVAELSALGVSYREIGKRLGVSAPRAGQLTELGRSRKPVPPRSS